LRGNEKTGMEDKNQEGSHRRNARVEEKAAKKGEVSLFKTVAWCDNKYKSKQKPGRKGPRRDPAKKEIQPTP